MAEIQPVLRPKPEFSIAINLLAQMTDQARKRLAFLEDEKQQLIAGKDYDMASLIKQNVAINHTANILPFAKWVTAQLLIDVELTRDAIGTAK